MLVITNRNLTGDTGSDTFGENVNDKGPNELRLARARRTGRSWRVEVVPEPQDLNPENLPSRAEYRQLVRRCRAEGKHCLFFVHGYNKKFHETLEQAELLETRYGVEVVLFSWPSNPGGMAGLDYRKARRVAQASFGALDSVFEKLGRYIAEEPFNRKALLECDLTINLMTYSMGNYLFQNYVLSNDYAAETRLFSNVILCQADVDADGHAEWVDKVVAGHRTYVTINENDKILGFSETLNYARLGKTARNLDSDNATYFDFTQGKKVGCTHQIWGEVGTPPVTKFFKRAFTGLRVDEDLEYDARLNAFRVP